MTSDERIGGFRVSAVPKTGLIDRMRGRVSKESVFTELRNLLATTPFHEVRESDVAGILAKGKLLPKDVEAELGAIYEDAVLGLAADRELSDSDRQGLAQLATCFELTQEHARSASESAVEHVYQRTLRDALADGVFTAEERSVVDTTARRLGMTEAQARRLYEAAAKKAIESVLTEALADKRYTADEEQRVEALAASLGVAIQHGDETRRLVDRCRLLAKIDDGQLPCVDVPILLQRGEVCHFQAPGLAYKELRTVTKRINYSGPSGSVRIMKGVRWRYGSVKVQRVTQDVLTTVDAVDAFITRKRLFLRGERKNTSVPLSKVVTFTMFSDGLQVEKETGKDLFLVGNADWEVAGGCLDAAARATR